MLKHHYTNTITKVHRENNIRHVSEQTRILRAGTKGNVVRHVGTTLNINYKTIQKVSAPFCTMVEQSIVHCSCHLDK